MAGGHRQGRPPVIVVHGLIHACGHLPLFAEALGGRALLVPDLPGFGANDPGSETSIARSVAYLVERMRLAGWDSADVVGHSIGGAVAMALAHAHPERVRSVVDLEGNFTLADAFWSRGVAAGSDRDAGEALGAHRRDVAAWLEGQGIAATPSALEWSGAALAAQSGRTMRSFARSVVELTTDPAYLEAVRTVLERGTPVHLVAGERSVAGWDVPDFVRRGAATFTVLPGVGHMMMLEDPAGLLRTVGRVLDS